MIFFNELTLELKLNRLTALAPVDHRLQPMAKDRVSLPITDSNNKKSRRRSQPVVRFPGLVFENLHYPSIYKT